MHRTDSKLFLDKMCDYFANIGAKLANEINQNHNNSFKIHSKRCLESFVLQDIDREEVSLCINNIKSHSAHGIEKNIFKIC